MGIKLSKSIVKELIEYTKSEYPNEACGILAGKDETITKVYKLTNQEKSPISYCACPKEVYKVLKELKEKKLKFLAIYHSHPKFSAYPSLRDIKYASLFWEDVLHLIISLEDIEEPQIKAYFIKDNQVKEEEVEIE